MGCFSFLISTYFQCKEVVVKSKLSAGTAEAIAEGFGMHGAMAKEWHCILPKLANLNIYVDCGSADNTNF